ncbi:alpha/beta hydrolase family esterase [Sinisalibacter aestuarii]|uniref:AB hydrolase-1 domain-containing protein n=1 Tax=Sinisalibacter aestuarii TaxID=2949426 RepID=A0ABQ5LSK0_9RHOB|nr:alpha/beta fold hydrolase [Sinisalibacter aestuarii]GKY87980.1 hypothetical protein STA1M1_18490 [Sinisalibacter aestuarii]
MIHALSHVLPVVLLIASLVTGPAAGETRTITTERDDLERHYMLTVPKGLSGPAPLVVAVHGLLEDGSSMRDHLARGRLDVFAEQYGFVVAYPSAWGRVWNIGEGVGAERLRPQRDDLAYLDWMMADIRKRAEIDPRRIFLVGFSQGGMIGFSYACKRPGLFRAVATVASQLPELLADDCTRRPPHGVLMIHGSDDRVVPYEGGQVPSGPLALMRLRGHDETVQLFARLNGCSGAPETRNWDEKDDGTSVRRVGWYGCAGGRAVEGYRIEGAGHRWPNGGPIQPITGDTTREIDGTAAVWSFFSRFR